MPEQILGSFQVKRLNILDEKGNADDALMPSLSEAELKKMYEVLSLSRIFDERALALQREGRLGTYPSILGQEASQIGSALAAEKSDWIFPTFRENGVYIAMGLPLQSLFQYWAGDERGMKIPAGINVFPISIPVGTQISHAVGAAMAAKYRKDRAAALVYFGDGGSSRGDFHEGLNMAGVFKLPVVFLCQNNQWAISVRREQQTAVKTIAQKAIAYGFEGIQVDGNDIFSVYKATKDAINKAKAGEGPTLIECFTYRMADHTTSDDATRYRSKEEIDLWKARDPIPAFASYLADNDVATKEQLVALENDVRQEMEDAVTFARRSPEPPVDLALRLTFAEPK